MAESRFPPLGLPPMWAIAVAAILATGCGATSSDELIQTLEVEPGAEIRVFAETSYDVTQGLLFEIRENGRVGQSRELFMFARPEERWHRPFRVVKAAGGEVVGVVKKTEPRVVGILHDLKTGRTWHGRGEGQGFEQTGRTLLKKFNAGQEEEYTLTE